MDTCQLITNMCKKKLYSYVYKISFYGVKIDLLS